MVKVLVEAAEWEGDPLHKLSMEYKWNIFFTQHDISELKKFLKIMVPLEKLFSDLASEDKSTLPRVLPTIRVNILSLLIDRLSKALCPRLWL